MNWLRENFLRMLPIIVIFALLAFIFWPKKVSPELPNRKDKEAKQVEKNDNKEQQTTIKKDKEGIPRLVTGGKRVNVGIILPEIHYNFLDSRGRIQGSFVMERIGLNDGRFGSSLKMPQDFDMFVEEGQNGDSRQGDPFHADVLDLLKKQDEQGERISTLECEVKNVSEHLKEVDKNVKEILRKIPSQSNAP